MVYREPALLLPLLPTVDGSLSRRFGTITALCLFTAVFIMLRHSGIYLSSRDRRGG